MERKSGRRWLSVRYIRDEEVGAGLGQAGRSKVESLDQGFKVVLARSLEPLSATATTRSTIQWITMRMMR
jgi:hypothetical protein